MEPEFPRLGHFDESQEQVTGAAPGRPEAVGVLQRPLVCRSHIAQLQGVGLVAAETQFACFRLPSVHNERGACGCGCGLLNRWVSFRSKFRGCPVLASHLAAVVRHLTGPWRDVGGSSWLGCKCPATLSLLCPARFPLSLPLFLFFFLLILPTHFSVIFLFCTLPSEVIHAHCKRFC